jgi:hypothetical protein
MAPPDHALQLVEDAYRSWTVTGPAAFMEYTAEGVELHDAPELPDAHVWVGREAVLARIEDVIETVGGRSADIDDVRSAGDEVLVSLTWRLDAESRTALGAVYHVVRVEGDRIDRVRVFLDEEAAISAAASA